MHVHHCSTFCLTKQMLRIIDNQASINGLMYSNMQLLKCYKKKKSEQILLVLCRKVNKKVENRRSCTLKDLGGCYVRRYVSPAGCSFCFRESHSTVPVLTVLYGQTCCWFHQRYFGHYTAFLCIYLFSQYWVSKLYVYMYIYLAL